MSTATHGLDNLAVIRDLEKQVARHREALHEIAQKAREYKERGNGQGGLIYRLAMDALFPAKEDGDSCSE